MLSAISGVTACKRAPSQGRLTALPPPFAEVATTRTMLAGMAKPMPCEPPEREKIAVLMPTSRPAVSTSAPPELPGLIAASVWMKNWIVGDADLRARHRRHDAVCHGLPDAERIADRKHDVADLHFVGIRKLKRRETLATYP